MPISRETHEGLAYRGFLPLLAFFFAYVCVGYYFSFSTTVPGLPTAAIALLTLSVFALIYVFMRHTAISMYNSRARDSSRLSWVVLFILLFTFSGYGFLSSSMLLLEGPTVLRDTFDQARKSLSDLENSAKIQLPVSDFDALSARVKAYQERLDQEIRNPSSGQYCGIGPKAKEAIREIASLNLPGVTVINGTDLRHNCADSVYLDGLVKSYDNLITTALNDLAVAKGVAGRYALLDSIKKNIDTTLSLLDDAKTTLDNTSSFIFGFEYYHTSLVVLDQAAAVYQRQYQNMLTYVSSAQMALQPKLETASAHNIASAAEVLSAVWERRDHISTYLYVLVALLVDGCVSYSASIAVHRNQLMAGQALSGIVPGSDVSYLWVPPQQSST